MQLALVHDNVGEGTERCACLVHEPYMYIQIYKDIPTLYIFQWFCLLFIGFCIVQIYMFILFFGDIHIQIETDIQIINLKLYTYITIYK